MNQSIAAAFMAIIIGLPCGSYSALTEPLRKRYGESEAAAGVTNSNDLIAVFTNPRTGSWTLLKRYAGPLRLTCILATGQGWETFKQTPDCGEVEC